MPAYNAGDYISESIESILSQTFDNFELIIIDDGSTDNSRDIVKSYHDSRIILQENPHDFIRSLNTGIELSKGKYIARMDADDIMLPNRLEIQYRYMEDNPETDVCGSWMEAFGQGSYPMKLPVKHEDIQAKMLFHNCLFHPTVMLRRESISGLPSFPNIYRQEFIYAEDYKLWTDLAMAGLHFANIPEILVKYCISETQSTSRFASRMYNSSIRTQSEYLEYVSEKLVENDERLFEFIDQTIGFFNENILTFNTIKRVIYDIYKNYLKEIRQRDKIKVLFCIDTLSGGGAEKLLIDILKRFNYGKYCVDLLILNHSGVYFTDIPGKVYWFTSENTEYLSNTTYDVEIAFLEGLALKYIARRQSDARKIAWIHVDLLDFHWTKQFYENDKEEELDYLQMDRIIFVSEDAKKQFNRLFPNIAVSQTIIYNLIDIDDIQTKSNAFQVEKSKLTLCCVGRLSCQKGQKRLIPVINKLITEDRLNLELWVLGEGEQRQDLEALIRQYSLEDVVSLKGFQRNPYPYMKASDIFVSASSSEGFSLVVAEALCLGKPVLSVECTGPGELLDNGNYGMLVKNDDESIYQGLKGMITDKSLREEYSRKAFIRSGIFDVKRTMDSIYDAITFSHS
jgi:glycosyltransferase involved in cell wall biosynthesis